MLDRPGRWRFAALCALPFVLFVGYALARPSIESLFLAQHGSGSLPAAWGAVALVSALAAGITGRLVAKVEIARLAGLTALVFAAILGGLEGLRELDVPGSVFALYVWKDVYVVVLVELFWTYANVVHREDAARKHYGFFGLSGALGGVVGNLVVGPIAVTIGSARVAWLVLPLLVVYGFGAMTLGRRAGSGKPTSARVDFTEGVRVVARSRTLVLLMALIATVQVSISLVDFEYNRVLETSFPDKDVRTRVTGQVYAVTEAITVGLHLVTPLVLRAAGAAGVMLGVPTLLALLLGAYLFVPRFGAIVVAKVASKAFDYSLWRNAKELIYIPLSFAEKTQGKAVADMFTYRAAKGGASALLLALRAAGVAGAAPMALGMVAAWIAITVGLVRRRPSAEPVPVAPSS